MANYFCCSKCAARRRAVLLNNIVSRMFAKLRDAYLKGASKQKHYCGACGGYHEEVPGMLCGTY